jgi:hypothetical protein
MNPDTERMTTMDAQYYALLQEADALYSRIYTLRKASFIPTHVGLGVWGRYEISESTQAKITALQKQRTSIMSKARRLKKAMV